MTEITAKLNYYRTASRKVRLVADLIRGKKIETAMNQLRFSSKKTAPVLIKLLKSAVSNAKNNFKIKDPENLYVKKITVDEGPVLKRHIPRARGMASPIKKRTSHITIVLDKKL
ncbi:MAG: 50S ribosomal protein L22 [Candidatus Terrybacteria bacterium]|nr:50S ribosomal protein L22 [Candidatus Terrybacteria bacterium]